MLYRTKAAMKILMDLTEKEIIELSRVVSDIQKRLHVGDRALRLTRVPKEEAIGIVKDLIADNGVDIPTYLRGHLERFLELMIYERVPIDRLEEEYCNAFDPVYQYELFKPETTGDRSPDPDGPEGSTKGPDISFSGTVVDGSTAGTDKEGTGGLGHIRDEMIDLLVERGLSLSKMASVFEMTLDTLISIKDICKKEIDETPLKELRKIWKEKEERDGQKEG